MKFGIFVRAGMAARVETGPANHHFRQLGQERRMEQLKLQAVWIVTGLGVVSLIGIFVRMRGGLHHSNMIAVCAVLALTIVTLVALVEPGRSVVVFFIVGGVFGAVITLIIIGARKPPPTSPALAGVTKEELTTVVKNELNDVLPKMRTELGLDAVKAELLNAIRQNKGQGGS